MNAYGLKVYLRIASAVLWIGSILLVCWCVLWPSKSHSLSTGSSDIYKTSVATLALKPILEISAADFEEFGDIRLQGTVPMPVYVPPPSPAHVPKPATQERPPLAVKLLGTVVESDRPLGMFSNANNLIEVRGVGQRVDSGSNDAEVMEIKRRQAVLRYRGKLYTLAIQGAKKG